MLTFQDSEVSRLEKRTLLKASANCHWVTADEWSRLVTSHRALQRDDIGSAGVRGLLDPATGTRYLIEEEELLAKC